MSTTTKLGLLTYIVLLATSLVDADAAVVESLTKGDAGALLSTRAPPPSFFGPFESLMRVLLAAGRITPLYTVDHKGSRKQDGAQKKYYGSYLIKLRRR